MQPEDFREFCQGQIERLQGAHPDMRFYKPAALEELTNWLEAKSEGNRAKAMTVVTEATEFENIPSIAQLNAIWARLFPPERAEVNCDCERCGGTGWECIERGLTSAARRCRNGCAVPAREVA